VVAQRAAGPTSPKASPAGPGLHRGTSSIMRTPGAPSAQQSSMQAGVRHSDQRPESAVDGAVAQLALSSGRGTSASLAAPDQRLLDPRMVATARQTELATPVIGSSEDSISKRSEARPKLDELAERTQQLEDRISSRPRQADAKAGREGLALTGNALKEDRPVDTGCGTEASPIPKSVKAAEDAQVVAQRAAGPTSPKASPAGPGLQVGARRGSGKCAPPAASIAAHAAVGPSAAQSMIESRGSSELSSEPHTTSTAPPAALPTAAAQTTGEYRILMDGEQLSYALLRCILDSKSW
jgi:hypothetical protein